MTFIPTPSGIEVVINQTYFNEPVVNVLNVDGPSTINLSALEQVALIVTSWWLTSLAPNLSNAMALVDVTCRDISVVDGAIWVESPTGDATGEQTSPGLPASVALCITHRTARSGRSDRGRTYVCGMVEQLVTGNLVDNTLAQNIAGNFTALRTALVAEGLVLAVKSLSNNLLPRVAGVLTPITSSVARDLRVDSQRRRLPS